MKKVEETKNKNIEKEKAKYFDNDIDIDTNDEYIDLLDLNSDERKLILLLN